LWFDTRQGQENLFYSRRSTPAVEIHEFSYSVTTGIYFFGEAEEVNTQDVKPTSHLLPVPRLRMCGVVFPLLMPSWHAQNLLLPRTVYCIRVDFDKVDI
jgi:hypothetical protein